ncbi:MAG: calcium-binding protein [Aestuariivirga sp.]
MPTRKWKNEFLVNTTTAGAQGQSAVTGLADGGFVIAWTSGNPTDSVIQWQRFDATGAKLGAEQTAGFSGTDQTEPTISTLSDGNIWIAAQDIFLPGDNDITGGVWTPAGAFVRFQQPNVTSSDNHIQPDVASLGANGSVAAWLDDTGVIPNVLIRGFNADGSERFAQTIVQDGGTPFLFARPSVAAAPDGSKFVVTWTDNDGGFGDIHARVFDSSGTALTGEFPINIFTSGLEQAPQVAWIDNTKFVTAWIEGSESLIDGGDGFSESIKYIIYDATGAQIGPERRANTITEGAQEPCCITATPGGGFVIAWEDNAGVIALQAFDNDGNRLGGQISVNTSSPDVYNPAVTALADGRVVVTWSQDSSTDLEVHAQIVDPRDGIVDGNAGANLLYGHDAVGDIMNGFGGADTIFGLNGDDQIYGGAGNDIADGGRGDDIVYGGGDNDTLIGGTGDDELYGEDGNDTLRGGSGADLLDGGAGAGDLADYIGAAAGVTAALDASLAGTGEALGDTFAGVERIRGSNFDDTLRGDDQANILFGQSGADNLNGRAGIDRLFGGLGIDMLTGGTQADRFEFAALTEIGDSITDFTAVDDTIVVTGATFGGGLAAGFLAASAFQSRADNLAQDANDRFIFRTTDKTLWFDADGNGGGVAVMVADLQAAATMTNADILIV